MLAVVTFLASKLVLLHSDLGVHVCMFTEGECAYDGCASRMPLDGLPSLALRSAVVSE